MKFNQCIKNLKIPRLLIETALIFGSVYFALVLEADRSRDFEREMLVNKLQKLEQISLQDSILFNSHLLDTNIYQGRILSKMIETNQKAIDLLIEGNKESKMRVYEMHKEGLLFSRLLKAVIISKNNIASILEDYDKFILTDSSIYWLENYHYHSWLVNAFVENVDTETDRLKEFADSNYFVLSANEQKEDILLFVGSAFYYNTLENHLSHMKILKYNILPQYNEKFTKVKEAINIEIQAQEEAMKGIF